MWPLSTPYPEHDAADVGWKEYDYIIVGGGTAGCVVASRLSENPSVRVLLLERGYVKDALLGRIPMSSQGPHANDQRVYRTTSPVASVGGRSISTFTSESLGGASRINGMIWTRGVPAVYNEWAEMGHPDWTWDAVEPYFIKAENARDDSMFLHRGQYGPMALIQHKSPFISRQYFAQTASSLGFPIQRDTNHPQAPAMGYFDNEFTILPSGHRASSYSAYLPKNVALSRRNLTVCTGTNVTKLELDTDAQKVIGVHIQDVKSGKEFFVKAGTEVIVANGTLQTPKLLMLSGVGNAEKLSTMGIPVKRNLAGVGAKLADHHACPVSIETPVFESYHKLMFYPLFALWHMILFLLFRAGWLRSANIHSSLWAHSAQLDDKTLLIKSTAAEKGLDSSVPKNNPDLEIMFLPNTAVGTPTKGENTLYVTLVRPATTGSVELTSSDPNDDVVIKYNLLDHPKDRAVMRQGLRLALKFIHRFQHSGYPHRVKLLTAPNVAGGKNWDEVTDGELDSHMEEYSTSGFHLSSTCPMGLETEGGVVDDRLRVHGFDNLRIADASVFPTVPSCHTMAPTIMVAERCADFVKQAWYEAQ